MGILLWFVLLLLGASSAGYGQAVYSIETFAGTDYGGEGRPGIYAPMVQPQGIAVDRDGSIVFTDAGDHRVRRLAVGGFVSSLAGDGVAGSGKRLRTPYGIAVAPNRDIYVADLGNGRVLRLASNGSRQEISGFQQPRNVAVDANGVLYVSDFGTNTVNRVRSDGKLEPATTEKLSGPAGLAFDSSGALYIADSGNQRVIAIKNGVVRTVLKDFGTVTSIAVDRGGRLYAAGGDRVAVVGPRGGITILMTDADEVALDLYGSLITVAHRQIRSYLLGRAEVLAGSIGAGYTGDGRPKEEWRFVRPTSVVRDDSGNLYIADSGAGRIRRIDAKGTLSTLAASLGEPGDLALDPTGRLYFSDSKAGIIYRIEWDGTSKVFSRGGAAKPFSRPSGLAFDQGGQLYVADTGNGLLRRIDQDGFVSTIAGGGTSTEDGFGPSIELKNPVGVAVAADGTVWFTEAGKLRKMTHAGRVTTIPDLPLADPRGLVLDDKDRLLIADSGTNQIFRVSEDGKWEALAGTGAAGRTGDDGPAVAATLDSPTDIWREADGSWLVCDTANNRIRKLTAAEAAPIGASPLRGPESAVPGQIAVLESDEPIPSTSALRVWFGDTRAEVVSTTANRISVRVPESVPLGWIEVKVGDWAIVPIEIVSDGPMLARPIENEDGTINSLENPASRTGTLKLQVSGAGSVVMAEVASLQIPVASIERSAQGLTITLQLPGGFLPSGRAPLLIWVDGRKVAGVLNVVIR